MTANKVGRRRKILTVTETTSPVPSHWLIMTNFTSTSTVEGFYKLARQCFYLFVYVHDFLITYFTFLKCHCRSNGLKNHLTSEHWWSSLFDHTVIKAFAIPINIDIKYMKGLMLLGKKRIAAPQNIQRMPPAE